MVNHELACQRSTNLASVINGGERTRVSRSSPRVSTLVRFRILLLRCSSIGLIGEIAVVSDDRERFEHLHGRVNSNIGFHPSRFVNDNSKLVDYLPSVFGGPDSGGRMILYHDED